MRLSKADFSFLRGLRAADVLQDAMPARLRKFPRKVVCQCGDGHRFDDWYSHLKEVCPNNELIHPVIVNGGALTLGYYSPLATRGQVQHDAACLQNIKEGCKIKDTNVVILGVHFPCGMAQSSGLKAADVFEHFISAKERLRKEIPGVRPVMLVHIDYEGRKKKAEDRFRTYFFNRERYVDWLGSPQKLAA
jgi:hypothetical protein